MTHENQPPHVTAVANEFLNLSVIFDVPITNLYLNKLLFFASGVYYTTYDKQLFSAPIEAWKIGPVVPEIYHEFKRHMFGPINRLALFAGPESSDDDAIILKMDWEAHEKAVNAVHFTFKAFQSRLKKMSKMLQEADNPYQRILSNLNQTQYTSREIHFQEEDKQYFDKIIYKEA